MGRLVLRHAMALDAGARDLDREVRLAKGLELGELRIGVGPWGGAVLVAPVVGRLHAQHPRLRMRVVVAPWRELPARLRARDVDIVVGALGEIEQLDEFEILAPVGARHGRRRARRAPPDRRRRRDARRRLRVTRSSVRGWTPTPPSCSVGLAGAVADDGRRRPPPELLTIECDSSDVLKRVLVESDAVDVHAPLRRRRRPPATDDWPSSPTSTSDCGCASARHGCAAGPSAAPGRRSSTCCETPRP